ncbi:MAG: hypothetical protein LBN06_08035 [Prevotellaceae bacterium]|jgi:tetratricopeptide (TPR) repeat protein|nr:hypothetical protein [Prevotellaceae bacterium]
MKKTVYILLSVFSFIPLVSSAQNCDLNETALRHWHRAKAAINMAEEPTGYKPAADEYLLAMNEAPDCADICYNLGLCYEQLGVISAPYYEKALEQFKRYLQLRPDADDKEEVQGKIYEMEYAIENATEQKRLEENDPNNPDNYIGRWQFHSANGRENDRYDIEIYKNEGYYIAKYLMIRDLYFVKGKSGRYTEDEGSTFDLPNTAQLKFENGICIFSPPTKFVDRWVTKDTDRELSISQTEFIMYLTYEDGKLNGKRKATYNFWASGNTDYKYVHDAIEDGHGRIYQDCSGDCGTDDVYFTKK